MSASVTSLRVETPRTNIERVDETTSNDRAEVTVALFWDGEDHVGVASGPPTAAFRPLLVAHATLAALQEAGLREFYAIEANTTETGGATVALVSVEDPKLDQPLVGAAVMPDDNLQLGFARATLDAVNRRIDA